MFNLLGRIVAKAWWAIILLWVLVFFGISHVTPKLKDVVVAGEYNFLPDTSPSRIGEAVRKEFFPDDHLASSIVLVVTRTDEGQLSEDELQVVEQVLKSELATLIPDDGSDERSATNQDKGDNEAQAEFLANHPYGVVPSFLRIRSPGTRELGKLLLSEDGKAALIMIDSSMDFMQYGIMAPVAAVEKVLHRLQQDGKIPANLQLTYTGSAVAGRDIGQAQSRSAKSIELWTLILIVSLLLLVYRAPLPVIVPFATLVLSLHISMQVLAWVAAQGWIGLFEGIQVYTIVVAYGAGVDFSMFLTSRFHEEIQRQPTVRKALIQTMVGVGPAVSAAAGTVIFGIGMMVFATFGKFHQAGISISFSLFVILLAALTLTPSILMLMGRFTFWPEMPDHGVDFRSQKVGAFNRLVRRLTLQDESHRFWEWGARLITRHPIKAWTLTVLLMLPGAIVGVIFFDHVSYGLISSLNSKAPSVQGTQEIAKHFSTGLTGPVSAILVSEEIDFSGSQGIVVVRELTEALEKHAKELHLSDVRSLSHPLGLFNSLTNPGDQLSPLGRLLLRGAQRSSTRDYFVGMKDDNQSHATRLDLVLDSDPFTLASVQKLDRIEAQFRSLLPEELKKSQVHFVGSTASIRDLQQVAQNDRWRITALVTIAVFFVLMILIRSVIDSLYLMATVIFSFLCTLGVSFAVFYALDPQGFPGLDWTVPTFLFTILVAVGQDYNIFLVTRIHEESEHHGPIGSVRHAVVQTAAIITSCGLIMAGTFSALIVGGELSRMTELGFSLAFGVLLDTMVVRPILVPAWFAWRAKNRDARAGIVETDL